MSECNCKEVQKETIADNETCPATGYQQLGVCVPVTVKPFAKTEATITKCCGQPIVTSTTDCAGRQNGFCTFTISQNLCIEVPVVFGATASVGDVYVDCYEASERDICKSCKIDIESE